jgi:chromate transporter
VVATLGIFLPAFVFVALSVPLLPRLRKSERASGFLDGVNVASLALMVLVTRQLGQVAIVDVTTALLTLTCAALLAARVNSTWLVLGGAAIGILVT